MYLYFSQERASIAPAFSGMWQVNALATRYVLKPFQTKDSILVGSTIDTAAGGGSIGLDRQYVTPGLTQGQVINGNISGQLMVRELATTDNVDRVVMCIKLVSNNGQTIRGTLLPSGNYGPTLEFINNATCRNKTIITNSALTSLTAIEGDRIVVEIGYQNSTAGTTPQAAAKWGAAAPLLPIDETQTTDGAGWLQIAPNLTFRNTEFIALGDYD